MKETFKAIIKADNERIIYTFGAYDYCDFIRQLNNDVNASYYNWEILKWWKL